MLTRRTSNANPRKVTEPCWHGTERDLTSAFSLHFSCLCVAPRSSPARNSSDVSPLNLLEDNEKKLYFVNFIGLTWPQRSFCYFKDILVSTKNADELKVIALIKDIFFRIKWLSYIIMTKMKNLPDLPFCKVTVYKIALAFKLLDRIKWGVIYCVNLTGVDWVRHGGAFTFHCCRAGNLTAGHRTTTTMTRDRPSWDQNIKGEVLLGIIARNAKLISITCLFFFKEYNEYMLVKITSNRAVGNLTNEYRRNRSSKLDRNTKFCILIFNRQKGKKIT